VWGLAQIAQGTRGGRGGPRHLGESQVRETLYGRPGQTGGGRDRDAGPELAVVDDEDDGLSSAEP
jgi:hypothetical protein